MTPLPSAFGAVTGVSGGADWSPGKRVKRLIAFGSASSSVQPKSASQGVRFSRKGCDAVYTRQCELAPCLDCADAIVPPVISVRLTACAKPDHLFKSCRQSVTQVTEFNVLRRSAIT